MASVHGITPKQEILRYSNMFTHTRNRDIHPHIVYVIFHDETPSGRQHQVFLNLSYETVSPGGHQLEEDWQRGALPRKGFVPRARLRCGREAKWQRKSLGRNPQAGGLPDGVICRGTASSTACSIRTHLGRAGCGHSCASADSSLPLPHHTGAPPLS